MTSENIAQFVQKGFHVTLGAASFMAETLQNPQKRDENMAKLRGDFNSLSDEWAVEGEKKEHEARVFVEALIGTSGSAPSSGASGYASSTDSGSTVSVSPTMAQELKDLTEQLASIRLDLEKNRES